jgi:hypothetical protein
MIASDGSSTAKLYRPSNAPFCFSRDVLSLIHTMGTQRCLSITLWGSSFVGVPRFDTLFSVPTAGLPNELTSMSMYPLVAPVPTSASRELGAFRTHSVENLDRRV